VEFRRFGPRESFGTRVGISPSPVYLHLPYIATPSRALRLLAASHRLRAPLSHHNLSVSIGTLSTVAHSTAQSILDRGTNSRRGKLWWRDRNPASTADSAPEVGALRAKGHLVIRQGNQRPSRAQSHEPCWRRRALRHTTGPRPLSTPDEGGKRRPLRHTAVRGRARRCEASRS
jgi:hypothetical protein